MWFFKGDLQFMGALDKACASVINWRPNQKTICRYLSLTHRYWTISWFDVPSFPYNARPSQDIWSKYSMHLYTFIPNQIPRATGQILRQFVEEERQRDVGGGSGRPIVEQHHHFQVPRWQRRLSEILLSDAREETHQLPITVHGRRGGNDQ